MRYQWTDLLDTRRRHRWWGSARMAATEVIRYFDFGFSHGDELRRDT
jgi:hypothetical protein